MTRRENGCPGAGGLSRLLEPRPPVRAETVHRAGLDRMEQEIGRCVPKIERRDAEDARRRAAEAAPPPAAPPIAATPPPAAGAPAVAASEPGLKEKASVLVPQAIVDRVKLGGYGSFRYEGNTLDESRTTTFTYLRFVLTADAQIAAKLAISHSELEFERFRKLEVKNDLGPANGGHRRGPGGRGQQTARQDPRLEQAWLQWDMEGLAPLPRRRGALVPLGRFNLQPRRRPLGHPRRSLVDRGAPVLPTTASCRDELGARSTSSQVSPLFAATISLRRERQPDTEIEQVADSRVGHTDVERHRGQGVAVQRDLRASTPRTPRR